MKSAQLINLFQQEKIVYNAVMMNILILTKNNVQNVLMVNFSTKIFITVLILKVTSKLIHKKLPT